MPARSSCESRPAAAARVGIVDDASETTASRKIFLPYRPVDARVAVLIAVEAGSKLVKFAASQPYRLAALSRRFDLIIAGQQLQETIPKMNQTATSQVELTRRPLHRYYHWELLLLLCLAFFFIRAIGRFSAW